MTNRKTAAALAAAALTLVLGATVPAAAAQAPGVATAGVSAASRTGTFYGTYQHSDGCVYLRSAAGYHYLLVGYTMGGNGGLYKKGGGFIAYPGWRIAAHGTQYNKSGTTVCTTWGAYRRIKATSIHSY
ncbi:hypothetical protein SAMN05216223_12595 [Actinacidiphila yanglinensis]|uniref:Uncharacterized protein n=1 Tax=Actinacidiphila yanglinensis TaxID=310779 RepID=A0A1H6E3N1_9ACTN|nr:hypothetical protein [Actinacidiphila yanglinensis]SEG92240.1 hypothetical protein SAMN05216223_12595 [Actinacidiphila yanglinensis]